MAKLSLMKRVITPANRSGAKKTLLKQDGITSDDIHIQDDDSSSLSDRQERRPKSKNKFSGARKLIRKFSTRNGTEEEGYESSSEQSTGSTRSTSSSFLRYQNRALWKVKLTKKTLFQRREDGSEAPVENESKWPMFDKIYKSQNQLSKKAEVGEDGDMDSDDNDSVSSVSSEAEERSSLAPPAPTITISIDDEEECVEELELELPIGDSEGKLSEKGDDSDLKEQAAAGQPQQKSVFSKIRALMSAGSSEADKEVHEESQEGSKAEPSQSDDLQKESSTLIDGSSPLSKPSLTDETSPKTGQVSGAQLPAERESDGNKRGDSVEPEPEPQSGPNDSVTATTQASGIPTSETETAPAAQSIQTYPTQKLSQPSLDNKPVSAIPKPPRPPRQKKKSPSRDEEKKEVTPISIPRTICYSLRSAIGDGSARQRNSHSLMERRPLRPNGCAVDVSYWSHRGRRNYMEDRFVVEHIGSRNKNTEDSELITLLAVFDGHGGLAASQFCSDWFSSYVRKNNEHFPDNLALAMKTAFNKIDSDFVSSGYFDGTTACAVAIAGKKIICCNAGDSRAIIIKRDGTAVPLSEDHKPDRNDETKRINDLGGRVIHWGRWRVEGVLAVSRSIGDARLKPYVTADPDIVEHEIADDDMFMVVASDGVWDTMSSDLVAKFVLVNTCKIIDKSLHVDDKLLRWIARQVSKRARENGSSDNISCIVAHLNGKCN